MKKILFMCLFLLSVSFQAMAFNPDPSKYEFIGMKSDGCAIFYEIPSAKADGQKAIILMLQVDSKNRIMRYYRNVVIDPEAMTVKSTYCELKDYSNLNLLDSFTLPDEIVSYTKGSLTDKIYQDLLDKGVVHKPAPVVAPTPQPVQQYVSQAAPSTYSSGTWQEGFAGGEEVIVNLDIDDDDSIIADF